MFRGYRNNERRKRALPLQTYFPDGATFGMLRIAVPADVPGMFAIWTSVHQNHMPIEALVRIGISAAGR